ncbi:unnamed protein product [Rhizoctonia solani]|uniref:Sensitive to high expression protein 9, mitochondrial n=1 Tax=Rhizoctonia solani TaxID=456999 RepID=A0A8H2XRY8_9AGAM|nr:unnamed protein product [Rhizoctonia solani]
MLAARRLSSCPLRAVPRVYSAPRILRYSTSRDGPNVTGPSKSNVAGSNTLKPEKTQVEADKIVKEYLDSIKPVDEAVSKPDSTVPSPSPKPTAASTPPLSEKLSSDVKKAGQSLSMWKDATLSLLRSRGEETAVQLKAFGGKLNKVTGYDEIEILKRIVVEKEKAITDLRSAARRAKEEYANAVSTRSSRQRQVNDLLQRKSSWTDSDLGAFTQLVREDHASAAAEQQAKINLEQAEAAVDAEFGKLMRAILDRYHEEQVWSDKIRSVSTYGSLAALVANMLVFVLAIVFVEPWKRKRLAQTFENRITEMSEETRRLVEGGMKDLGEHFEKQEGVLAALATVVKTVPVGEELPPIEPVPVEEVPSLPQLDQAELVERAKVLVESLTPSTDRDYALMALKLGAVFPGRTGKEREYPSEATPTDLTRIIYWLSLPGRGWGLARVATLPGQKNEPTEPISISCRFVATDQWLRTHVDPHWTISELKRHLLAKCVGGMPLVPGLGIGTPGPRLLVPSPSGQITLASLVRPINTAPIKAGGRPSTAPHALLDDRRKPRLSLKVVPSLAKPGTISGPRTVTIHPPTPGIFGVPGGSTGPQPAPFVYFSPRNPVSSPELSPPSFIVGRTEDDPSPSSPNTQLETMSMASRSTVALGYSQPQSHTTSPTFSAGASPPSRPFSPTSLPQPPESQPLFTPNSEHSLLFSEFASTTPSATGPPPSPYAPTTARSPPPIAARSPPLSSSLTSRYEASISNAESFITESDAQSRSQSPLLSAAEFFRLPEPDPDPEPSLRSPSPSAGPNSPPVPAVFTHRPTPAAYPYDAVDAHGIARKRSGSREKNGLEEEFRLVSFAQGCVLDEHSTVADLRIRPGELLEIQRKHATVHLARPTYTQPYFEAPIYVIKRTVGSNQQRPHTSHHHHHTPRPHQHHIQPIRDYSSGHRMPVAPIQTVDHGFPPQILPISPIESVSSSSTRMRSRTITTRDRDPYDGIDPDLDEGHDYAELDMSGLEGVGGGAPLPTGGSGGTTSGWSESSVRPPEDKVEWKLRWLALREGKLSISRSREKQGQPLFMRPLSNLLSAQQLPAVPQIGSLPRNYISIHFTGSSRKERERDEGIGIRMMDGAVHVHLFRVLLRIINTTGAHVRLPTDTPIIASAPLASQYPEWRQYIVQRAWLAGRGTSVLYGSTVAGPWMRAPWIAWTDKEAESFIDPSPSESEADYESDESDDAFEFIQTRDSDSEIEWDNEAWRAWESENAFGTWNSSSSSWLRLGSRVELGRPRSRSLATPSRSLSQPQTQVQSTSSPHHETLLSPVSTSSEISTTSPNTRRARSSTIADSPGNSPQTWARTAGIETVLKAPASNEAISQPRRASNQSRGVPGERRGSSTSLEMQRAMPSRRAVTTPAQGAAKFL